MVESLNEEKFESKQNCDHFMAFIGMNCDGSGFCSRCGQTLNNEQKMKMALMGREYCLRMIAEQNRSSQ